MNCKFHHTSWTAAQLFALLAIHGCQRVEINGVRGVVSAIQREDGSGRCFNVTLAINANRKQTVFVRTVG